MKAHFLIFLAFCLTEVYAQKKTETYLKANRQDLLVQDSLSFGEARIIGFGALHGSARTEEVEQILLKNWAKGEGKKYYYPETDYCTARYFQEYVRTGDEALLKELVQEYGARVPQEKTIEVFEKWKKLRILFVQNEVDIAGIDKIASYRFSVRELTKQTRESAGLAYMDTLRGLLKEKEVNWMAYYSASRVRKLLEAFVRDYDLHTNKYLPHIADTLLFNHVVKNLRNTFHRTGREQVMYENYLWLQTNRVAHEKSGFFRMGVYHIMKSRINGSPTFFSLLLENGKFTPAQVLSIQGFLTDSRVLWDTRYVDAVYSGHSTKGGYGISDHAFEHFKGIRHLKKNRLSSVTLYLLNKDDSPYKKPGNLDLVKLKRLLGSGFWTPDKRKSTTDYIDYAILITDSGASRPLEEMDPAE